jgi:hypothetical protein
MPYWDYTSESLSLIEDHDSAFSEVGPSKPLPPNVAASSTTSLVQAWYSMSVWDDDWFGRPDDETKVVTKGESPRGDFHCPEVADPLSAMAHHALRLVVPRPVGVYQGVHHDRGGAQLVRLRARALESEQLPLRYPQHQDVRLQLRLGLHRLPNLRRALQVHLERQL